MEITFKKVLILFFLIFSGQLFSQENHYPIKIEERIEKYTETNSKHGSHVRTKKQLFILYNDNTAEVATKDKLTNIFKSVPLAGVEYQKYKANNVYMASSIPFFAVTFWSTLNVINGKNKEHNTLVALLSLAGGTTIYELFDFKKKRNINRLIAYCNNYWKNNNPQSELKNMVAPDYLKVGAINQNTLGIGLFWNIGE